MTFASETARFLFHQLPTERQVELSVMEDGLATHGQCLLQCDSVMTFDGRSEVLIRITFDHKAYAAAGDR